MNPILNTLTRNNLNRAKKIVDMMKASENPNAVLQEIAKTNQSVRQVMDLVNKAGNPRDAFYQMASAKGVDPEAILSMIRK